MYYGHSRKKFQREINCPSMPAPLRCASVVTKKKKVSQLLRAALKYTLAIEWRARELKSAFKHRIPYKIDSQTRTNSLQIKMDASKGLVFRGFHWLF